MAHHLSAIKRIRTNRKANLRNRRCRSLLRSVLRRFRDGETQEPQQQRLQKAVSVLDKLAAKGIIHRNTAARKKSGLYRQLEKSTPAS